MASGDNTSPLARAMYAPPPTTRNSYKPRLKSVPQATEEDDTLADVDIQAIGAELDTSAQITARDQMISTLEGRVAELTSSLTDARATADSALMRIADLEAALAAQKVATEQAQQAIAKAGISQVPTGPRAKLTAPHGYIDEATGRSLYWQLGEVVTDPKMIEMLKERGAPIVDL